MDRMKAEMEIRDHEIKDLKEEFTNEMVYSLIIANSVLHFHDTQGSKGHARYSYISST